MVTLVAAITISSVAAVSDIRFRAVPNWLTYPAMLLGVGYHTMVNGAEGFFFGAGGLFLGLGLLIVFYLAGGTGAGDVKLMGAVGALLGPNGVFVAFIFTAVIGGFYGLALLLLRLGLQGTFIRLRIMFTSLLCGIGLNGLSTDKMRETPVLRYGVAIALGVFISIVWNFYTN